MFNKIVKNINTFSNNDWFMIKKSPCIFNFFKSSTSWLLTSFIGREDGWFEYINMRRGFVIIKTQLVGLILRSTITRKLAPTPYWDIDPESQGISPKGIHPGINIFVVPIYSN